MNCPRCAHDNHDFAIECEKCGVVFSKAGQAERRLQPAAPPAFAGRLKSAQLPAKAGVPKGLLLFGLIGALIAHAFWPSAAALGALQTLFHETWHAVVAWLLGHPSIPAFDFMFGGGVTTYGQFRITLALAIAAGFGYLGWRFRERTPVAVTIGVLFLLWLFVVTKEWRRETVMASAGAIFELLLGATFLYMTIANVGWRAPQIERPLGAVIAFFSLFKVWIFSMGLIRDREILDEYMKGKGGAMMNDLDVIAVNLKIYLGIGATVQGLAKLLLVFSVVPYAIAFWLATRQDFADALQARFNFGE